VNGEIGAIQQRMETESEFGVINCQ
jgi:hypothetical protein